MRALSLAQASRCETAKNPTCRCRCHGELHGKERAEVNEFEPDVLREFFEALPEDDPHHVRSLEEQRRRAKMRRAAARNRVIGQATLWPENL